MSFYPQQFFTPTDSLNKNKHYYNINNNINNTNYNNNNYNNINSNSYNYNTNTNINNNNSTVSAVFDNYPDHIAYLKELNTSSSKSLGKQSPHNIIIPSPPIPSSPPISSSSSTSSQSGESSNTSKLRQTTHYQQQTSVPDPTDYFSYLNTLSSQMNHLKQTQGNTSNLEALSASTSTLPLTKMIQELENESMSKSKKSSPQTETQQQTDSRFLSGIAGGSGLTHHNSTSMDQRVFSSLFNDITFSSYQTPTEAYISSDSLESSGHFSGLKQTSCISSSSQLVLNTSNVMDGAFSDLTMEIGEIGTACRENQIKSESGKPKVYSKTGIDVLDVLDRLMARPNPMIELGPVDLNSSFIIVDAKLPDSPIVFVSKAFEKLTGYTSDEIIGHNCRFLQSPYGIVEKGAKREFVSNNVIYELKKNIENHKECQIVHVNYKKGGEAFMNLLTIVPLACKNQPRLIDLFIGFQADFMEKSNAMVVNARSPVIAGNCESFASKMNSQVDDIGLKLENCASPNQISNESLLFPEFSSLSSQQSQPLSTLIDSIIESSTNATDQFIGSSPIFFPDLFCAAKQEVWNDSNIPQITIEPTPTDNTKLFSLSLELPLLSRTSFKKSSTRRNSQNRRSSLTKQAISRALKQSNVTELRNNNNTNESVSTTTTPHHHVTPYKIIQISAHEHLVSIYPPSDYPRSLLQPDETTPQFPVSITSSSFNSDSSAMELTTYEDAAFPLIYHSPTLITVISSRGIILYANPISMRRILGVDAGEWIGRTVERVMHPGDVISLTREMKGNSTQFSVAVRYRGSMGYKWMNVTGRRYEIGNRKRTKCCVLSASVMDLALDAVVGGDGIIVGRMTLEGIILYVGGGGGDGSGEISGWGLMARVGSGIKEWMNPSDWSAKVQLLLIELKTSGNMGVVEDVRFLWGWDGWMRLVPGSWNEKNEVKSLVFEIGRGSYDRNLVLGVGNVGVYEKFGVSRETSLQFERNRIELENKKLREALNGLEGKSRVTVY